MKVAIIRNGKVENFVAVSEETREATIAFFTEQGLTVYEGDAFCEVGWFYNETDQSFYPGGSTTQATWLISKRAFKNRFPRAKWNAASMASNSNPLLYDFFETYREVPFINLKDEETQYALMALSMENIPVEMRLTGEEVDAVLNVGARPDELP